MNYANTYNHLSAVLALKLWRSKQPKLFVKRVYE